MAAQRICDAAAFSRSGSRLSDLRRHRDRRRSRVVCSRSAVCRAAAQRVALAACAARDTEEAVLLDHVSEIYENMCVSVFRVLREWRCTNCF